ncbi:MAG TPA: arabinosyltransferase domain-containing protein [Pseudonocardia sp.]|uniref:arabinosyltransferase domain-containing protein n=1 Tax=Pseudonocardia sp. TaxID=60912 RepID=UPI002B4B6768|nr:arabinosyltransferase domain-containing protein [Pseudonocardia sp.]HLU57644.1 arabinosyltransferase domain-containing protein [Pseudonocardia sp.]
MRSRSDPGLRRAAGLLGSLAVLAAVAFPFAPVEQPEATYSWTAADGDAAIPLQPYQPVALTAEVSCPAAREAAPGEVLLATVPHRPDVVGEPLQGLRLTADGGSVRVESAGVDLGAVALPPGDCTVSVVSDPDRTAVLVDGRPALERGGDVRPDVAGAFSDVRDGVGLRLTADARFETAISPLKAAIGVVGGLALLGVLLVLHRVDRARRVRLLPPRWWRPRPVDGAVAGLLGLWWAIGAITVDDGYIAGIVRSAGANGFIGNAYRWLNAPEAPFSWFYGLYHQWSLVSPATAWMRLPSTLLGLLLWWLVSRLVLPRLGRFAARRWVPWAAALAFATWWVPFGLGLRPEPWVAVGALAVYLAVERALATARLLPLAVALVLAGATTALTPGGLMAFTPFLAAGRPLLAQLRGRRDLPPLPLLAVLAAAATSAVYLMVPDQSLAGMLEAVRVRTAVGGGQPWFEETDRYARLLGTTFQGAVGRRAAVLGTLLAAAAVLWALPRVRTGIAAGPARRLVVGLLLSTATLTFAPTKWTQHFGDLAGYGTAVLVLGAVVGSAPLRARPRAFLAGLAATTVVGAVVLAGYNLWPYQGAWFTPTFSTIAPRLLDIPIATILLVVGAALVVPPLVRRVWRRAGGEREGPLPRRLPTPTVVFAGVLACALALQVLITVRVAVTHRDSYTLASDLASAVRGRPCGLQERLSVETDPAAGLLPVAEGEPPATVPVDVGGRPVPGVAVAGRSTTPWFSLAPQQRAQALPVVVSTSGTLQQADGLYLEFGDGTQVLERRRIAPRLPTRDDVRELAPAGATTVRLAVDAPEAAQARATLPRAPRLTRMTELLPPGSGALLDWPVAFLFPCLTPEPLPLGTAALPRWRVGPPLDDAETHITYQAEYGGPFAAPRLLITERRMPTYLDGDPLRDAVQLYRWLPIGRLAHPEPVVTWRTVGGWERTGHPRVPSIDPVG